MVGELKVWRRGQWIATKDLGRTDADGYFSHAGRADDVFKASDYRISPFELESALIEHAAVAEVAVVPLPDAVRHALPKAYCVLVAGAVPGRELAAEVFAFARRQLAPYKQVRRLEFVAELPKTPAGKVNRKMLRTREGLHVD